MTHDEKTIILCAFRYAVYSDLEDSAPIIEFIGKNLDDYDVSDMETLLDDVHFSLQFLKNAGRREITHIRAFGNRLKRTIKEREKADGVFPKPRTTRTPTFFIGDTGFSRFLIVMAFAYAAPRHSYMFGLLQGITRPYIENFTKNELRFVIAACGKNFPDKAFGGDSDQIAVSSFIEDLEALMKSKPQGNGESYMARTNLSKVLF